MDESTRHDGKYGLTGRGSGGRGADARSMDARSMDARSTARARTNRGRRLASPALLSGRLGLVVMAALLGGCGTYQLQGKAVEGATPAVLLVDQDDPRLEEPGLSGAVVALTLDPDRLSAKHMGNDMTDVDGRFSIAVDEFGAGVLEHDARLDARLAGHRSVSERFQLPGRGKRVLVVLARGGGDDEDDEPTEDFLDETLRMGEPYMD